MVRCIRLTTGEEIISDLTDTETGYLLKTPANIFMTPNGQGGLQIQLMPLFPYAEKKEFEFPKSAVLVVFNASRDLTNEYNRIFGSGIVIPTLDSRSLVLS